VASLAALTRPRSPNAVDGLAHLGGFAAGLLLGSILYPAIHETRRHRLITWGCRIVAIPLIVLAFVLTIKNFCTSLLRPIQFSRALPTFRQQSVVVVLMLTCLFFRYR
jgi:hypothetical protein